MINDELGAPVEEISERQSAMRPFKPVGFLHALQGIAIRRRVSASRWCVNSFSAASSSRRAFSHSSCETI